MTTTDMRHDGDARGWRAALAALIALTVAVGVVTFTLSFVGLRDYGIRVQGLNTWLAPLVPVGVDILSLCGVAATYLLRHAAVRVRAYAWLVFGVAVALSVAGNLTHAVARHLSAAGMVGAAAWPILLALAAHLVIVTRRALERHDQHIRSDIGGATGAEDIAPEPTPVSVSVADIVGPTTAPTVPADNPDSTPATSPRVASRPARKPAPKRQPRPRNLSDNDLAKHTARRRVTAGESCATVARDVGVAPKTVERWTTDIRAARDTATTDKEATA
jgi:hypothetical protein